MIVEMFVAAARSTGSSAARTGSASTATTTSTAPSAAPSRSTPRREEGLVAELRIAKTALGDETLTLADEEILDASAGFLPMPDGEQWESRARRRLDEAVARPYRADPGPGLRGAPGCSLSARRPPMSSRRRPEAGDAEPGRRSVRGACDGAVLFARATELPAVVDHWVGRQLRGTWRSSETVSARVDRRIPAMRATDQMLARIRGRDRGASRTFIDGVVEAAEKEGRDLTAQEMELVTRARDRLGELNEQTKPLQEARADRDRVRERIAADRQAAWASSATRSRARSSTAPPAPTCSTTGRPALGAEEAARAARAVPARRRPPDHRRQPRPAARADRRAGRQLRRRSRGRSSTALGPRQLPSGSWTRPKVTQHTNVAEQSAEKTELVSQKMIDRQGRRSPPTPTAATSTSRRQDIDWSQPAIMDIVINDLAGVYAQETEKALCVAVDAATDRRRRSRPAPRPPARRRRRVLGGGRPGRTPPRRAQGRLDRRGRRRTCSACSGRCSRRSTRRTRSRPGSGRRLRHRRRWVRSRGIPVYMSRRASPPAP